MATDEPMGDEAPAPAINKNPSVDIRQRDWVEKKTKRNYFQYRSCNDYGKTQIGKRSVGRSLRPRQRLIPKGRLAEKDRLPYFP